MAVKNIIGSKGFVTELISGNTGSLVINMRTVDVQGTLIGNQTSVTVLDGNASLGADSNKVYLIDASGGRVVINLPDIENTNGFVFSVKKTDTSTNHVQIVPSGSQKIDSDPSKTITEPYTSITAISNNGNWWII